jgi:hypothetical protein
MEQNQLAEKMETERGLSKMSQTSLSTLGARVRRALAWVTTPHPDVIKIEEIRKAELLSTITFILSSLLISAVIVGVSNFEIIIVLTLVTLSSYLFSRTTYHQIGAYLFTYAFTALGYISIYRGSVSSIDIAVATTVHIAIVFSSVLLPQGSFLLLIPLYPYKRQIVLDVQVVLC